MASQPQVSVKRQQELQLQYSTFKNTLQQLAQKIGDIEQETEEHKLVIETLGPLPQDRKCFRMVNGVLVERTIKDVIPSLKTNSDGLKQVLDELLKQYKTKQTEMDNWKVSEYPPFNASCSMLHASSGLSWIVPHVPVRSRVFFGVAL
ncbi:prefoldin subunit 2, putative [Paecilomyces variotii No. 5]|uniref:Prefoldin subunit 2, putative n=1 Tax=Byssochlamys spectabilis (strain No. 5 / NBRC 109023) TaxID=1356009 RepID=V5HT97_BYSSN|nr:prefoldin subunit 2, putative [Paecilomyces variotii No. 5]